MSRMTLIEPDWPLAGKVGAAVTTRKGGVSKDLWGSLNLGLNTVDNLQAVEANRKILAQQLGQENHVQWLRQVHGTRIVQAGDRDGEALEADACYSRVSGRVCAVLTADCLPLFLGDASATEVAVVHAGWRGMAAGIIARAVEQFCAPAADIHAWLGPAISAAHYEVGDDLRRAFQQSAAFGSLPIEQAFQPRGAEKWSADLYELARLQLHSLGVGSIWGGDRCTFAERDTFYSYRRDGETGRFASLIWLKN